MSGCIFREASKEPASCYIIKSQATGSRTIVNYNDLPDMTVNEFIDSVNAMATQITWFHFEVYRLWLSASTTCTLIRFLGPYP